MRQEAGEEPGNEAIFNYSLKYVIVNGGLYATCNCYKNRNPQKIGDYHGYN